MAHAFTACSVQDMLEQLRPDLQRFESFEEACDAVAALDAAEAATLAANGGLAPIDEDESEEDPESESDAPLLDVLALAMLQGHMQQLHFAWGSVA